jgi:branched-chain amino acid transport system substrate-binding protein
MRRCSLLGGCALSLIVPMVGAEVAFAVPGLSGTLYVQQELLDDCPDGCLVYSGTRMLWRVSPGSGPSRFRALVADSAPAPALVPAVSPQGDLIVYADQHRDLTIAPVRLSNMMLTGAGVRVDGAPRPTGPLGEYPVGGTDPTVQLHAAWSPDGSAIALAGQVHQALGIWTVARNGTGWRRLPCKCDASGTSLDWSSTGVLAFDGATNDTSSIWSVNADGLGLRRLTSPPKGRSDSEATWSPDGTRLAFVRASADGVADLEVLDLRTGVAQTIAKDADSPAWSPDGTQLAYIEAGASNVLGEGTSESVTVVSDTRALITRVRLPAWVAQRGYVDGLIWRAGDDTAGAAPTGALAIYSSLGLTGVAREGSEALRGEQLALADVNGAVDGRSVVLQSFSNAAPGARSFSYELTVANALRAAHDPNALAYIGEDDSEASMDSTPILNEAGLAQVSPKDAYSDLTSPDSAPSGTPTYARLQPRDAVALRGAADLAAGRRAHRVWIVSDDEYSSAPSPERRLVAGRLAALGAHVAGHSNLRTRGQAEEIARRMRRHHVDAMVYAGGPSVPAIALWNAVHRSVPRADLYGGQLGVASFTKRLAPGAKRKTSLVLRELPAEALGPAAVAVGQRYRATYGRPADFYALAGYEAMSLLLDAIHRAGPGPTRDSVRDALFTTRQRNSILGTYSVTRTGKTTLRNEGVFRIARDGTPIFENRLDVT